MCHLHLDHHRTRRHNHKNVISQRVLELFRHSLELLNRPCTQRRRPHLTAAPPPDRRRTARRQIVARSPAPATAGGGFSGQRARRAGIDAWTLQVVPERRIAAEDHRPTLREVPRRRRGGQCGTRNDIGNRVIARRGSAEPARLRLVRIDRSLFRSAQSDIGSNKR